MTEDFDGVQAVDSAGESLGKVERTYVDDANAPRFIEVKIGTLLPKHRLVPTGDANRREDGQLQVPYSRDMIEGSPDAPEGDTLEAGELDAINAYYSDTGQDEPTNPQPAATVQDDTTATEDTGGGTNAAVSSQFEIIDESAGGLKVGDQIPAGLEAPIRDRGDIVEVPVLEEVLVKRTVVREILRVKKSDLIERETVEGDVRKEDIEIEDGAGAVVDSTT